jgi:hypothetical protein
MDNYSKSPFLSGQIKDLRATKPRKQISAKPRVANPQVKIKTKAKANVANPKAQSNLEKLLNYKQLLTSLMTAHFKGR